ncbi:MAG: 16S rRNA (uracil(1498)-N(3))-methyltransferase [Bdellovibrionales bacterium]|nr:16S rRNA (uracil(1498)-N(3))-methyltransferase [Bdellovibrionales bacterium]
MNLILIDQNQIIKPNLALLNNYQSEHLQSVLNAEIGDTFNIGVVGGLIGKGCYTKLSSKGALLHFEVDTPPPQKLPLSIYIALPRPKHISRIVESLTSLGVSSIHFFHSYKVNKSFWSSDLINPKRILSSCRSGLEQSKDTILPTISFHRYFKPFVEDELPLLSFEGTKIIAHPYAEQYNTHQKKERSYTHLVLGPEGGFIDFELDLIQKQGFQIYRFNDRVLKLETAAISIASMFI